MVVLYLKFIGPFLRINSLNENNISSQLFHLSKESLNRIVLHSKCGIPIAPQELNKHMPKTDFNSIKGFSPLLCVYKKASAKLSTENHKLCWNTEKFKKEIPILSNALMTLCLLELCDYYKGFKAIDKKKYSNYEIYSALAKCQLQFYVSNLRNVDGVFVDKLHDSELFSEDLVLSDKKNTFKFSEQAFLMNAYYRYSMLFEEDLKKDENSYAKEYRKFSLDILNLFMDCREYIYENSFSEKLKLFSALNLFYNYSRMDDLKPLLLDLYDLILEEYHMGATDKSDDKVLYDSLLLLNSNFMYKNLNFLRAKEFSEDLHKNLISIYDKDLGLYVKTPEEKTCEYNSTELISYLMSLITFNKTFEDDIEDDDNSIIESVYKNGIANSGLVLSWPDTPNLNDPERYRDFYKDSENLLDEDYFRMQTLPTPENNELAPVFVKKITYNRKKHEFKVSKSSFYSTKNMTIFFMSIFLYNNFA